jgi:hypothetical protein
MRSTSSPSSNPHSSPEARPRDIPAHSRTLETSCSQGVRPASVSQFEWDPDTFADLRLQRLEDPLPEGPCGLVVSVLAVRARNCRSHPRAGSAPRPRPFHCARGGGGTLITPLRRVRARAREGSGGHARAGRRPKGHAVMIAFEGVGYPRHLLLRVRACARGSARIVARRAWDTNDDAL